MTVKLYLWALVLSFLVSSCGTNKKLQASEDQLKTANEKNEQLARDKDQLAKENNQLHEVIASLTSENKDAAGDLAKYKKQCESMYAKYKNSNDILTEQDRILKQIEEKLEAALADLEGRGMSVVNYKKGMLFVSLEDQLLYKTGSSKLDQKGIDALAKIAAVMSDYPDVTVVVVGNTDDAQFKNGSDNWSLSTERANAVVRILRDVYKIDPARLTAAGRSKFHPVAENTSAEGRAKNRRIDIIFNPDLDKLWESLDL